MTDAISDGAPRPAPSPGTPGEGWGGGWSCNDRRLVANVPRANPLPSSLPAYRGRERARSRQGRVWAVATKIAALSSALPGCGNAPPPSVPADVEYAQAMSTGRSAFDRGDADQAALFFGQALRRAEARDEPADIGDAAYNLAVAVMPSGAYDRAAVLLAESLRELARVPGARVIDVRLMQGRCAYRAGDLTTAAAAAAEVAAAPAAAPGERADALLLQGEIALDQGDRMGAERLLARSRAAGGGSATSQAASAASPATTAGQVGLEARLAEAVGQPGQAAPLYDQQAAACRAARLYPQMSEALVRAGRLYVAAGDPRSAADRWLRAARSLRAQGDVAAGAAAAREAVAAATAGGDPGLVAGLSVSPLPGPSTAPTTSPAASDGPATAPDTGPESKPASRPSDP